MDLRNLVSQTFKNNRECFCDIFIGEVDGTWLQSKRDVYELIFGIATDYQQREAFRNLFEHDNETTIDYAIDCLLKEIVKES